MDSTNLETQRLLGFDSVFDNSCAIGTRIINLEFYLHLGTHLTDMKMIQGHLANNYPKLVYLDLQISGDWWVLCVSDMLLRNVAIHGFWLHTF